MMDSDLVLIEQSFSTRYSLWVREALGELVENFTITDPSISGHPIVFASDGFLKMTGYSKDEVIGRNGRIFQGPKTNRRSVMEIREAIREEKEIRINLLNYRKDGTPFWMFFHLHPVFGVEDGRVIHFVGVQVPISRKSRKSGNGFGRNGGGFCDGDSRVREIVFGSCRREICSDSSGDFGCVLDRVSACDSDFRGIEEPCEASEDEKQRAANSIDNVLSVLTHHSEVTGRLVCGKRRILSGNGTTLLPSSLSISLGRIKQSFVLTDPNLPDMPIVYASDAFFKLTGYSRYEVLGRNCRFLSGVDTDSSMLFQIKENIQMARACTKRLLNYRKDNSSFWNLLHISPVRDASGKIAYFAGVQIDEEKENLEGCGLSTKMRHLSTIGAVKVAVRSSSMGAGPSRDRS